MFFLLGRIFLNLQEKHFPPIANSAGSSCEGFWEMASLFHIHEYYKHGLKEMLAHTSVISFVFEHRETMAPNNVHSCVPGKLLSWSLKEMCLSVWGELVGRWMVWGHRQDRRQVKQPNLSPVPSWPDSCVWLDSHWLQYWRLPSSVTRQYSCPRWGKKTSVDLDRMQAQSQKRLSLAALNQSQEPWGGAWCGIAAVNGNGVGRALRTMCFGPFLWNITANLSQHF